MVEEKEPFLWHDLVEDILDHHLSLLAGKVILETHREFSQYFQVDYVYRAGEPLPEAGKKSLVRPLDHAKEWNIVEYKSIHQTVTEEIFRHYVARALYFETRNWEKHGVSYQGKATLTILTTRKPESLIARQEYAMEALNEWKYRSHWVHDLDIYLLVQKGMRGQKAGEALALLQVLEGEREKQKVYWQELLQQNLSNVEVLQQIIERINKETYMNLVEELKKEGRQEGQQEAIQQAILDVLELRFGPVSGEIIDRIREISEVEKLRALHKAAILALSLRAFSGSVERP